MDEPKFVQAAPSALSTEKVMADELKVGESRTKSGFGRQLREDEIDEDADSFLCWLVRYPVERNHPRPTTDTVPLKKSGDAVVCSNNDKLIDVLQKLVVEGFLALPVLSSHDNRVIGFIDLLDIVWYTLWSFGAWREEQSKEGAQVAESKERFSEYLSLERFRNALISDVMGRPGFGTRNLPLNVYRGFSLLHPVEIMARLSAHRIAITNAERKVTGILTQSMVISLLDQHLDRLGSLCSHTVTEMLPGLSDELCAINETDMALSAFKMMVQHNVNGLAVVNANGELVDTISVRDLRGIGVTADRWTDLWRSVKEFKAICRQNFPQQTPAQPIFVTKDSTMEQVIKAMDDGNIHRIFVCEVRNEKPIPTHCISQRDVFRFLLWLCGLKASSMEDIERAQEVM